MARIPLQTANRSLDTGSVVQYPSGSPIGSALEGAGNQLQAVAQRFQQKQDQKDGFDARLRETEFTASLAGLEDQTVQTAPEDAGGIHDAVVGQIDPSGAVVKPGNFDTLFDQYKARVPASQQADFEAKRESYRLQSSNRMAGAQYAGEQAYYKVQIEKTQTQIVNSIPVTGAMAWGRASASPVAVGAGRMSGAGVVVGGAAARAVAVARRGGLDRSTPQAVRATAATERTKSPNRRRRWDRTRRVVCGWR